MNFHLRNFSKIIKKGETATCGGVQIPVEAFGAWSTLRLYIQKIVYGDSLTKGIEPEYGSGFSERL